ncbi:hypothetical protein F4818DRAFT_418092 [Hypoxylon cercidicola]|nr:hypothetical protein F4818DRAFT_418092 [Hypoxylon cercidicola]
MEGPEEEYDEEYVEDPIMAVVRQGYQSIVREQQSVHARVGDVRRLTETRTDQLIQYAIQANYRLTGLENAFQTGLGSQISSQLTSVQDGLERLTEASNESRAERLALAGQLERVLNLTEGLEQHRAITEETRHTYWLRYIIPAGVLLFGLQQMPGVAATALVVAYALFGYLW